MRQACRDVKLAAARADETGSENDRREFARAMEALGQVVQQGMDTALLWEELRPAERAKFAEDAKLLASGEAVEIDDELLAAVPFGNLRFGRN